MLDYDRATRMNELLLHTMLDGESLKYNVSKSQAQKGHVPYNLIIISSKPGSTPRAVQVRTMAFHLLKYFQQSRKHPPPFFSHLISATACSLRPHCSSPLSTLGSLLPQGLCSNCSLSLGCSSPKYVLGSFPHPLQVLASTSLSKQSPS